MMRRFLEIVNTDPKMATLQNLKRMLYNLSDTLGKILRVFSLKTDERAIHSS